MQAGQACRNQTSSSKGSYQKTTFRFNVAFHVPLDKIQRKGTSVPALSSSGALFPRHARTSCLPSGPPLFLPFSSPEGAGEHPPRPLTCLLQRLRWSRLSSLHQWLPHPIPAQKATQTSTGQLNPPGAPPSMRPVIHPALGLWGSGTRTVSTLSHQRRSFTLLLSPAQ